MQGLYDRGHIYEGVYEGWYCPNCADFKTEQELLDGNRCPIHKIVLEKVREENYFFRLSSFQEQLEQLYAERPEWVLPRIRYNEALSFIKGGLEDVSVSRPKLQWGVRVPVGREPGLLRLVRRAPQLLHGAPVRARRGRQRRASGRPTCT